MSVFRLLDDRPEYRELIGRNAEQLARQQAIHRSGKAPLAQGGK